MESLNSIEDVIHSVKEHIRAIREFKHDMYMRYNNTDSQDKKDIMLNKIHNIEQVMTVLYDKFEEDYYWLNAKGEDNDLVVELRNSIDEFHKEILSLK